MFQFSVFRDLLPTCPGPLQQTVRGFSQYQRTVASLPGAERKKVDEVAVYLFASFRPGCTPMLSVKLVGHADTDLQKGHKFEHDISVERSLNVEVYLRQAVGVLSRGFKAAPGAPVPTDIQWSHQGVGATQPSPENRGKNPNTLAEHGRALNRRVEILLAPAPGQQPTQPWSFDPVDARAKLQKVVEDSLRRRVVPQPGPTPQVPSRFFQNLPPLDKPDEWRQLVKDVKKFCQDNHVDTGPMLDTFKDLLQLPGGGPGPFDEDLEKELRRRQVTPDGPPTDDD